jgi:hypothetical protein
VRLAATPAGVPAPDEDVPALVVLHVWGVGTRAVPPALTRMAVDRALLPSSGAAFWKLLGTGTAGTFRARDADLRHWAVLTTWPDATAAERFEHSPTVRAWDRLATERLTVHLRPLASRGSWAGRRPFGDRPARRVAGPVASLTRARLRPSRALAFWRSVPDVSADLRTATGVRLAIALGEAPLGWQATFSVWDDLAALTEFAHRRSPHAEVVRRTDAERWYAEELFARFEVLHLSGSLRGRVY